MLDIKQIAVGRLVLDNFPHIKSYWQMTDGQDGAESPCALASTTWMALIEEKIYHERCGAENHPARDAPRRTRTPDPLRWPRAYRTAMRSTGRLPGLNRVITVAV